MGQIMSSTLYTIGTALRRAHDHHLPVTLLVEGQWLHGVVVAVDGHGAVIDLDQREHSVVRLERISAVRVQGVLPTSPHHNTTSPKLASQSDGMGRARVLDGVSPKAAR
jgi:hypothetical protein